MKKSDISELLEEQPNSAEVFISIDDDLYEITAIAYLKKDNRILFSISESCPCCGTDWDTHD